MKRIALFFLIVAFSVPAFAQLSSADREFAINYLESTHEMIKSTVTDLSDEKWNYVPEEGGWSVSNCLEHILITEGAFFGMAQSTVTQSEPDPSFNNRMADAILIGTTTNRGTKVTTAPQFEPSGQWDSKEAMLEALEESRSKIISYLESTDADLRHIKANSPMGEIDLYQLFLLMSAHSQRHTFQMMEVLGGMASN